MKTEINRHFQGVDSTSIQNAMHYIKIIHAQISDLSTQERVTKKPAAYVRNRRNLTEAEKALIEIAPTCTKNGLYDRAQMLAKLREQGYYQDLTDQKAKGLVADNLSLLVKRNHLPKLSLSVPTYKTASPEEITQNEALITYILYKRRRLIPHYWHEYISHDDAMQVGRIALKDAIERFRPGEHPKKFGTYAAKYIDGRIAEEVNKAKRRKSRQISLQEQNTYTGRTVEETLGKNDDASEEELLQKIKAMHALHVNGTITFPNFSLWVLNKIGHGSSSLGRFFGCSKQVIDARLHKLKKHENNLK